MSVLFSDAASSYGYIPPMTGEVCMDHWWNYTNRLELKFSEEHLSQCHFVHYKSHNTCCGIELCPA